MEKELNPGEVQPDALTDTGRLRSDRLELAHVFFMDLVAFSTLPMEEQRQRLSELQEIVQNAPQVRDGERDSQLIRLPTGDGMALVFFGDPIVCVECALEISAQLKKKPLNLRMGINTGPVYRLADINANLNAAGGGINTAQRITDAGDAGHILVSQTTADILLQFKDWAPRLHDLGEHPVKHGVNLHFYNLYTAEFGNPALPSRFRAERAQSVKRKRRRIIVATVAALLVAALGLAATSRMLAGKRRRSVAVMGFRNITSRHEADWVSTDLAEGLRTQLATTGKLRTISGEESAEMWKDLGLTQLDSMGKNSLSRLQSRGADMVIVGSYTDLPDGRIHLNVEIQDTAAGETVDSLVAEGTESEITQLIAQTGERLRAKMGLGAISAEKERQFALSQPSPEAAPVYSEGLEKLRAYEPMQARSFLERAVIIDPAFPFAHSALGETWLVLGYDQKAKDEAKKAFELSANLSFEDHTSIEARYRGIATDWPAAIAAYQQLYKYSQNQKLDYGLKLAEAQRSAGKGRDALATLAQLRKLSKGAPGDPRIDLEEAETAASLGDLKRGLGVANQAAETAKATGARLLESRSLIWSCVAFRKLGEMEKGKQACEQAKKIATDLEDKLGTARAVNNLANISNDQGDLDGAKRLFEQSLALGRAIGDQRDVSGALNNIGSVLSAQGQLADAKERYEEALKIQQDIGFKTEIPNTLGGIGDLLLQQGDLAGAQRTYEQAIAAAQESGSERAQAGSKANLGIVLFERGDLRGAEQNYRDALALERKLGAKSDTASVLDSLADLLVVRGNLQEAEQGYREAMAIQEGMGEKGSAAISRMGLATISLERNDAAQAEAGVRASAEEFHSEKDSADETVARVVLVRALVAQKKLGEAQKQMNQAIALVTNASQNNLRYSTFTTSARLRAAQGGESNEAGAIEALQKIVRDADKAGMPGCELEARLAIGEIEAAGGKNSRGRTELSAVQKDAEAKGFLLIAQKAVRLGNFAR
jgi:tetratricopeptide (TPR) repeat protein/class 3 adenylate cyclase/TolB-like protein